MVTRLLMPAQGSGATGRDRAQGSVLHRREPMSVRMAMPMRPDDVRELEPRTRDRAGRVPGRRGEGIENVVRSRFNVVW